MRSRFAWVVASHRRAPDRCGLTLVAVVLTGGDGLACELSRACGADALAGWHSRSCSGASASPWRL